jgi:hypothetical protein
MGGGVVEGVGDRAEGEGAVGVGDLGLEEVGLAFADGEVLALDEQVVEQLARVGADGFEAELGAIAEAR